MLTGTDIIARTPTVPKAAAEVVRRAVVLVAVVLAAACGGSGAIEVDEARYRAARPDLGAAYMEITNDTDEAVVLGSATAAGVGRIELHETVAGADGTMSMRERPDGFEIAPGETLRLEPGGPHLMIFDPTNVGEELEIVLDFGDETVTVPAMFDESQSASTDDGSEHGDDHG